MSAVAIWFDLDRVEDYHQTIWASALREILETAAKVSIPFAIYEGTASGIWINRRWPHRLDVEGLVIEVLGAKKARALVKALRRVVKAPGVLAIEALPDDDERCRQLSLRGWYRADRVLVTGWLPESELHHDARLPIAYWDALDEMDRLGRRFGSIADARWALGELPVHGTLPSPDDVSDLPLFHFAARGSDT